MDYYSHFSGDFTDVSVESLQKKYNTVSENLKSLKQDLSTYKTDLSSDSVYLSVARTNTASAIDTIKEKITKMEDELQNFNSAISYIKLYQEYSGYYNDAVDNYNHYAKKVNTNYKVYFKDKDGNYINDKYGNHTYYWINGSDNESNANYYKELMDEYYDDYIYPCWKKAKDYLS